MAKKPKSGDRYAAYRQTPKEQTIPAPTGGWNARDPLTVMDPRDAIVLDNCIPGNGDVSLRNGYESYVTGLGSYIETLMEHASINGTNKLFAATPDSIYNVTTAGAVGAAEVSSLTNGRWQHCMFETSAGNYLVSANGADDVRNYDGTSWTTPSITGVTSSDLISVTSHVNRLWFVEKNTLNAWYLGAASISGSATKLALGAYCQRGGYLMAIGSWSRDGGSGMDDLAVFLTNKGEVVIYSGTDPSSSTTWSQVGTFRIPPPIGRRCIMKAGSDLGILTAVGLIPLSQVLTSNQSGQAIIAITDKISNAYASYFQSSKGHFGWQPIEYPSKKLLIINVPATERSEQYQFVMNVRTGAWCRWTSINAGCWSLLGDDMIWGDNSGTVWKLNADYHDDADTISGLIQPAFNNLGNALIKHVTMARPMVKGPIDYTPIIEIKTDYDTSPPTSAAAITAGDLPMWDVALWGDSWGAGTDVFAQWQDAIGEGVSISPAMRVTLNSEFSLNQIDIMYRQGGPI